jgi:glucose-1-phosphate thymidylyltransferase
MKAVVLAGGAGTRLLPLTEIVNKHLLPVGRVPMIFHPIRRLVEAGIDSILVVTGGNCPDGFLSLLKDGTHLGAKNIYYAYQQGSGGIAAALKLAKDFIGNEDFAVILGDNIFLDSLKNHVNLYKNATDDDGNRLFEGRAKVFLSKVSDPTRFGCPEFEAGDEDLTAGQRKIIRIIEKPTVAPSPYAVTGIYFYPPTVFTEVLPWLKPSLRGELEVTDINNYYLSLNRLDHAVLSGGWSDAGTWPSWEEANKLFFTL